MDLLSVVIYAALAAAFIWGAYALFMRLPKDSDDKPANPETHAGGYGGGPDFPRHRGHDGSGSSDVGGSGGGGD